MGRRPFNWEQFKKVAESKDHEFDMSKPEKIVMVGDMLTTDVIFGNLNKMSTVWVN